MATTRLLSPTSPKAYIPNIHLEFCFKVATMAKALKNIVRGFHKGKQNKIYSEAVNKAELKVFRLRWLKVREC